MSIELWYPPKKIVFTRDQMLFLIEHIEMLSDGKYPADPNSHYTDVEIQHQFNQSCPFQTPVELAAEVKVRLAKTGTDGKLLVWEVWGNTDFVYLQQESRDALNYISGWKRKAQDYRTWLSSRKYEQHNRKKVTENGENTIKRS